MAKGFFCFIMSGLLLCLGMSSCRTAGVAEQASSVEQVLDTVKTETLHTEAVMDSVCVRDSVSTEYRPGRADSTGIRVDTLRESRWHREYFLRQEHKVDTVTRYKTVYRAVNSVTTRTVSVARELTRWQRFLMGMGSAFCMLILFILCAVIFKKG